jgi:hypothetical protein
MGASVPTKRRNSIQKHPDYGGGGFYETSKQHPKTHPDGSCGSYETSKHSLAYMGGKIPEDPHFLNIGRGSLRTQENLLTGSANMDEVLPLRRYLEVRHNSI